MFNLKKQEITMKEYIAPVAKTISIDTQESLLLSASDNVGWGEASNRREETPSSASDAIWGSSWED